jgi:hypothetical protein
LNWNRQEVTLEGTSNQQDGWKEGQSAYCPLLEGEKENVRCTLASSFFFLSIKDILMIFFYLFYFSLFL